MTNIVSQKRRIGLYLFLLGLLFPIAASASDFRSYHVYTAATDANPTLLLAQQADPLQSEKAEAALADSETSVQASLGAIKVGFYLRHGRIPIPAELAWLDIVAEQSPFPDTADGPTLQAGMTFASGTDLLSPWADIRLWLLDTQHRPRTAMSGRINQRLSLMPEVCGVCVDLTPAVLSLGVDLAANPRYNLQLHFNW